MGALGPLHLKESNSLRAATPRGDRTYVSCVSITIEDGT